MAIKPASRRLSEAELNAPDLDDDGNLDVEHYPIPDGSGIADPYLRAVWDEAVRTMPDDSSGDDDEPVDITLSLVPRDEWSPYTGPHGGHGFRNVRTNEVVYGDKHPGRTPADAVPTTGRSAKTRAAMARQELTAHTKKVVTRAAVEAAAQAGHVVMSVRQATDAAARRVGAAVWDATPPRAQRAMVRTYRLAKAVEHKAMIGFTASRELAQAVATERGLDASHVETVGKVLAACDLALAWSVNAPLAHAVLAPLGPAVSFPGAKVAAWIPVASLAYIAYSTSRNPFATVKAARKFVAGKLKRGHMEMTHAEPAGLAAAVLSLADAAPSTAGTPPAASPDVIAALHRGVAEHGEWYAALVSAAMDEAHDLRRAVEIADEVVGESPKDPSEDE